MKTTFPLTKRLLVAIFVLSLASLSCVAVTGRSPSDNPDQIEPTRAPTAGMESADSTPIPTPVADATEEPPPLPPGRWQAIPDLPRYINALIVDPTNPDEFYAGTGFTGAGSGVYKSEDGGKMWQRTSNGLPSEDVVALAFDYDTPPTLYAVLGSGSGDLYASDDGAANWHRIGEVGLLGFTARLVLAPVTGGDLFVVSDVRGGVRSDDGGHTWQSLVEGLPKDTSGTACAQSLVIDPVNLDAIYLGTGCGPFNGNGVYKSADGGETWATANRGMIDYSITALAIDPSNPQTIYAGAHSGEIFKSIDGGRSWADISPDLADPLAVVAIAIDPTAPQAVYALSEWKGLIVSQDGGEIWQLVEQSDEIEHPSFSTMAIVFDPQPMVIAGTGGQGGWRYAEE